MTQQMKQTILYTKNEDEKSDIWDEQQTRAQISQQMHKLFLYASNLHPPLLLPKLV